VYAVSGGKSLPEWLKERGKGGKAALKKDADYRRRIELVQDFGFKAYANRMKLTPDGQYMIACGGHPPQLRTFELSQVRGQRARGPRRRRRHTLPRNNGPLVAFLFFQLYSMIISPPSFLTAYLCTFFAPFISTALHEV
jgi:hypothetical protein